MAEFGQPARTAVSDANAGFVNPPATREVARTQQSQSVRATSDVDAAAKNLGSSLGNSLQKLLSEKADNINAQRTLAASMRQGEEKAVNAVDLEKKRSGWSESLFGQNIEYRAAQQQAVVNNIQQTYLEQANKISEFAADTPEQYKAKLSKALDKQLEVHEGDPETRDLIIQNWSKSASKLVAAQHKEHVGFAATQRREVAQNHVRGIFDAFTTESQNISTPEEAVEFIKSGNDFFAMKSAVFADMSTVAARGVMNEEIEYSLSQGNIGAYNMARGSGWLGNYNKKEQASLAAAINKYDVKAINGINLTVSEARLAAGAITGENAGEQLALILEQAEEAMVGHADRTSGTDKFELGLSQAKLALQGVKVPAIKKASKEQAEAEELRLDIVAQNLAVDGVGVGVAVRQMTKPRAQKAAAARLVSAVGSIVGDEELNLEGAIGHILQDPVNVGSKIVQLWGDSGFDSGMLKAMGQSYINGFSSSVMTDEDQQPTEAARNAMQLFAQFEEKDRTKFRKQIGEDAYEEYLFIKQGQTVGKTSDMITRDIVAYTEAKGNSNYYAADWTKVHVGSGEMTKREFIRKQVKTITGSEPLGTDVGRYLEIYGKGLLSGKGDHQVAKDALYDAVQNKAINYNGQVIHGAGVINSILEEHTLGQLLDGMQTEDSNDMTGLLTVAMGRTDDENSIPIRTIFDRSLNNTVKFKVAVDGGLWMDSSKFQSPLYMSQELLHTYEKGLIQRENDVKLAEEIKQESAVTELLRQIETAPRTR